MALLKLKPQGRGKSYSWARGVVEAAQSLLYARHWPARFLDRRREHQVQVVRHELDVKRGERPPLRLGFASDLHIGPLTPVGLLEQAFDRLAAEEPDVVVLGGDYVFLDVTPEMAAILERLVARLPAATKLAVLGNHDLWTDHGLIESALERGGARVLVNRTFRLPPPHDDVAIVCLDDPWTGEPDPDRAFAEAGDASVRVAVCHAPEGYPHIAGRGASLMLCGHTHGGQVAMPDGPLVVWGRFGRRWPAGMFDVEGLSLFVSRGLGAVDIPLRVNASPDVAIFTLR